MAKKLLSIVLCLCMVTSLMTVMASASATNIQVAEANYYEASGDVESLTINFGWDTASATSRLTVMTQRLRSAGEAGTSGSYGDFTDYGYYGRSFKNWNEVLKSSDKFGMLYYADEQKMQTGKTNTITLKFDEGDIPLDKNQTYYLYLWTYYGGYYYPDNLFMVMQVKDGKFQFAPATGRNTYGSFTTLWEEVKDSAAKPAEKPAPAPAPATPNFTDVKADAYYATPVKWAVEKGITSGKTNTTFAPNEICTRAHILTFLWRAAGSPESKAFLMNPYTDIQENAYYYKAALWAKERGLVEGTKFAPNTPCTRAATVEYFWKVAGSKTVNNVPFSDVKAGSELAKAVSWAVDFGITNGTTNTTFAPNSTCTRGQIVTFLHRYYVAPLDNSAFIASVTKPAAPAAPAADAGKLDPLPPEDYTKQPDWYGTLTPAHTMSNARLVAELEQIEKVIADRRDRGIYMSDGPYSRQLDLWSQASQRNDVVQRYDRGIRNDSLSDSTKQAYDALVAQFGSADPLREYFD